ncbi:hypothetical protein LTS08_007912 [Lithohypha guttulata]|uniref:uncharacterized protein n=1 Tax=Lithohypha guttulata TaxID=1690604 RepID=UPI002DE065CD|nr:hypothetical protein LTR51_007935 [Lithohypha guttulata]KAK5095778.1 hypothetical protein LTS08_007912 [Lithohypha guttulata]
MSSASKPEWHEAYPQPRPSPPDSINAEDLLALMHNGKKPGVDYLVVDLRRNDHEGGSVRGSLNLPAQSLFSSLPTVLNICQGAKIPLVIWYCGSSQGRGTRAANWFRDLLEDNKVNGIRSVILKGGIKGWAGAGSEYTEMMDGYIADYWTRDSK